MDLKYCFSTQIRSVATSLIKNTYSGSLNDLRASPKQPQECQILVAVIVHTVSVFITKQSAMFHQPFTKMLAGSSALLVSDRSVICLWSTLLVYIYTCSLDIGQLRPAQNVHATKLLCMITCDCLVQWVQLTKKKKECLSAVKQVLNLLYPFQVCGCGWQVMWMTCDC